MAKLYFGVVRGSKQITVIHDIEESICDSNGQTRTKISLASASNLRGALDNAIIEASKNLDAPYSEFGVDMGRGLS